MGGGGGDGGGGGGGEGNGEGGGGGDGGGGGEGGGDKFLPLAWQYGPFQLCDPQPSLDEQLHDKY